MGEVAERARVKLPWSYANSRPIKAPFQDLILRILRKGRTMENYTEVPIWEKYSLTIEEASKYFRIGENKLRKLAEENLNAGWVLMNGNRIQIKRKKFEKVLDNFDVI